MAEPLAKRLKIIRGEDDYMPGNITEIDLHNFMTFNHLKCKLGSRLNLVIGPNRSGKSSLVCAIAFGLGGEPQLLGRAINIGSYVKRSGYIKITLRGATKEEKITIMRKMDTRNKSEWFFNVCEFAKLTPLQLLEETEKAVGDPQLPIRHRALVEKSKELKNLKRAVETNEKTLDQHKTCIAEQQREVERVRQREELREKAKTMEKKLPWLRYDMNMSEYMEAKEKEKDAKSKLDEAAAVLNDLKEPIGRQKQEKANLDIKVKEVEKRINDNSRKHTNVMEKAENLVHVTDRLHANYLEGHVPYYIWKSFITQDSGDWDLLVKNF